MQQEGQISRAEAQSEHMQSMTFSMSASGAIVCSSGPTQFYYNEELGHPSDGECYSEYEANLKPLVKRGTYEQFLAVYIPDYKDDDWYFQLACEYNQLQMAQYIYNNAPDIDVDGTEEDVNPLSMAVRENNIDIVRWLLTLDGVNVRGKTVEDYPVLTYAVHHQFPSDIIIKLIDLGARPHQHDKEWDMYPLHEALEQNRLDVAMHLLMHDFDPYLYLRYEEMTAFDCNMSPKAESLLHNYPSIMLRYCLDMSGAAISANDFAMIAEEARLEPPVNDEEGDE